MMEILGFIVALIGAVGFSAGPFVIVALSSLGGGLRLEGWIAIVISISVSFALWYFVINYAPFKVVAL